MSGWGLLGTLGGLAGGYYMAEEIAQTGDDAATDMGQLAAQLQNDAQFTGYSVSSPWATSTVGPDGSTTLNAGREEALSSATGKFHAGNTAMQNAVYASGWRYDPCGSGDGPDGVYRRPQLPAERRLPRRRPCETRLRDTAGREQNICNSMAMQQPQLDAAQAQSNAQEFAAGRGGVVGSQFGGTGEDAAMAERDSGRTKHPSCCNGTSDRQPAECPAVRQQGP